MNETSGGEPVSFESALRQYVADFGVPRVVDASRVRAALTDLLGSEARALREDIDAAAIAVEEGLLDAPGRMLFDASGDSGDSAATAALVARGVSPEMAATAVSRWATALGSHSDVTSTLATPTTPDSTSTDDDATVLPHDADLTVVPNDAELTVLPEDAPIVRRSPSRKARLALIAAAVVGVLAITGGALAFTSAGDDPDSTEVLGRQTDNTTSVAPSTTTSTTTTSTTVFVPETTVAPPPDTSATPPPVAPTTAAPRPSPTTAAPPVVPPTAPPTVPPTAPPPVAPVATNESWRWTPGSDGAAWYQAALTVTKDDSGTFDYIEWSPPQNGHIQILGWDGSAINVQPHHNGPFTDRFQYRLRNQTVWSNWATVDITVDCNTAYVCYG